MLIHSKANTKEYDANYDAIFKKNEPEVIKQEGEKDDISEINTDIK